MLENRVLRRIFMPKRDEVTGEWRKLHKEKLGDLCSSPNIFRVIKSRRMRWTGCVARMGERRGAYRTLVGNTEGKRPLVRGGADKFLAQEGNNYSEQTWDLFNIIPTKLNTFLSSLL